jgi:hypothetical protein
MNALDLSLVLVAVAGAASFLVWQVGLRRSKPPACHPGKPAKTTPGTDVVLGGALARGLDAARKRRGAS